MPDRNATCAERITQHRDSRLQHIGALEDLASVYDHARLEEVCEDQTVRALMQSDDFDKYATDPDEIAEAAQTAMWELPLSITTQTVHRIDLSTGGPADWLEVFADSDGDITRVVYHFADWFDHAQVELQGYDFQVAEDFARTVIGLD